MTRKRHAGLLLLLLAACSAPISPTAPARVVEPRVGAAAAPRGAALLRQAMLARHATARAAVGVAPLAWDDALAADARDYAETLARNGRFEHAHQRGEGENLFTGTRGGYAHAEMADLWAAERRDFVNAPTPAFSRTGRWQDVAHYTQMIWRNTTALGCALASNATDDYLVCRYAPAGNVVGERAY